MYKKRTYNVLFNQSNLFVMVRVERIELSSQVWKTCILTVVLHSHILILSAIRRNYGVGNRN